MPGQAFRLALHKGDILLSLETLHELSTVLSRRKFDRYLRTQEREEFLATLVIRSLLVDVTEHVNVCSDPKDNKFLAFAVDGKAHTIVSGDNDLFDLHQFHGIPILTPAAFLTQFEDE